LCFSFEKFEMGDNLKGYLKKRLKNRPKAPEMNNSTVA
jgi:hypothetical protein